MMQFDAFTLWLLKYHYLIHTYVWIGSLCLIFPFYSARYVEVELDVYWDREKTERVYFHPYKPVSWLLTHEGILLFLFHFSPNEIVITKQACTDESILSLFFLYLNRYRALILRIEHCKTEKSNTDFLFIHTYIYIYIYSSKWLEWNTDACHFELYFALHPCVLSTFQKHLLQFPTIIYIYIYIYVCMYV